MSFSGYVDKLEVEEKDCGDLLIDGSTWLDIRVAEHASHVLCIHFHYQVSNTDNVHLKGM